MNYNDIMKMPGRKIKPKVYYYEGSNKIELLKDDIILAKPFFNASLVGTIMKGLELELTSVLPNKPIYFENTAKYGSNSATKTIGPYYLKEEPTFNADSKTYTHKLYDDFIKSMVPYKPITITYPCSLIDFFKRLCVECNFTTNITSLPNGQRIIDHDIYDGLDFTYRDVFEDIGQATATLFKNNSGNVEKCSLGASNIIIDDDILRNQNISLGEHFGPINSIVLSRAGESDSIYKRDESLTTWNEFKIVDNILMSDNNRSDYLDDLYTALSGLEYDIFDLELVGFGGFEPLQKISIKTNNKTYNSYVFNNEEKYTQGYEESIYTELPTETVTDYNVSDKTDKRINQVYIIANKQEKRIDAVVSEQKQIQQDITTSKTAESNPIEVTDAGEYPLESIGIKGKSYQETTTGKNKFIIPSNSTSNGVTLTNNDDGSFNLHGTATAKADFLIFKEIENLDFKFGNTYTLSSNYETTLFSVWVQEYDASNWVSVGMYLDGGRKNVSSTIVKNPNAKVIAFQISVPNGTIVNLDNIKIQLEEGQVATDIEHYTGGIPSPNPEYPQEIKTVQGVINEFDLDEYIADNQITKNHCTVSIEKDEIVLNCTGADSFVGAVTSIAENTYNKSYGKLFKVESDEYSIVLSNPNFNKNFLQCWDENKKSITPYIPFNTPYLTFHPAPNVRYVSFRFGKGDSVSDEELRTKIMLVKGKVPKRYVPSGRWLEQITHGINVFCMKRDYFVKKTNMYQTFLLDSFSNNNIRVKCNYVGTYTEAFIDIPSLETEEKYVIKYKITENTTQFRPSLVLANAGKVNANGYLRVRIELNNTSSNSAANTYITFDEIQIVKEEFVNEPYEDYKENTALIDMNKPNEFIDYKEINHLFLYQDGRFGRDKNLYLAYQIPIEGGKTYTVEKIKTAYFRIASSDKDIDAITNGMGSSKHYVDDSSTKGTIPTLASDKYLYITFNTISSIPDIDALLKSIKVYEGYEPYYEFAEEDEFLDGNFTDDIQKLVLTGNENFVEGTWGNNVKLYRLTCSNMIKDNDKVIVKCTHAVGVANKYWTLNYQSKDIVFGGSNQLLQFVISSITTLTDFKTFLTQQYNAGTPVIVYYILETPKTYKLNYEPLKLFKGYNYITLNDELYPNLNIKYLTDSKMNADFMTHSQFNIESDKITSEVAKKVSNDKLDEVIEDVNSNITQTADSITDEVNGKFKDYSTTKETNAAIKLAIDKESADINLSVSQKIEDIQIGGTNLGRKGCISPYNTSGNTTVDNTNFDKNGSAIITRKVFMNEGPMLDRYVRYEVGQDYVISFEAKTSTTTANTFVLYNGGSDTDMKVYVDGVLKQTFSTMQSNPIPFPTDSTFHKIELHFKAGTTHHPDNINTNHLILQFDKGNSRAYTAELRYFKIEKGNKATDWSPAPEDMATNSNVEAKLELYVGKDENNQVISMMNAAADEITLAGGSRINITTIGKLLISAGNFKLDTNGNINCTGGTIGGWNIDSNKIQSVTDSHLVAVQSKGADGTLKNNDAMFYVYDRINGIYNFYLLRSGYLYSKNAYIEGVIKSSLGEIGGWTIGSDALYKDVTIGNTDYRVYIQAPISSHGEDTWIFSCQSKPKGSTGGYSGNFHIDLNGNLYCKDISLSTGADNMRINASIEIFNAIPYIDFHWNAEIVDYTARIIEDQPGHFQFMKQGGFANCKGGSWTNASSKLVKKNIKEISDKEALALLELKPVSFDYKNGIDLNQRGLIAEEVLKVMPDYVIIPEKYDESKFDDTMDQDGNIDVTQDVLSLDYSKFVVPLIKLTQIQEKRIKTQEERITELENKVNKLLEYTEGKKEE